jgi:hypothetical protein
MLEKGVTMSATADLIGKMYGHRYIPQKVTTEEVDTFKAISSNNMQMFIGLWTLLAFR